MGAFSLVSTLIARAGAVNQSVQSAGVWRPPQWSQPAQTSITVPATSQPANSDQDNSQGPVVYVFDAVLRAEHQQELRKTEHPVQTGANIIDHAYLLPARVTLEVGMSDAMDSYEADMWSSDNSKSVSAYQTLLSIQQTRVLVTLTTRLNTYQNMLVESIQSTDTKDTQFGLRAVVVFGQILLAQIMTAAGPSAASSPPAGSGGANSNPAGEVSGTLSGAFGTASARPQTTNSSPAGTVQSLPPTASLQDQHSIDSSLYPNTPSYSTVPGAGTWSSNNLSSLG